MFGQCKKLFDGEVDVSSDDLATKYYNLFKSKTNIEHPLFDGTVTPRWPSSQEFGKAIGVLSNDLHIETFVGLIFLIYIFVYYLVAILCLKQS